MVENEYLARREEAIKTDMNAIRNRVSHAFNQGYELGRERMKDYRTAFKVTCELCTGGVLFGSDYESIRNEFLEKQGSFYAGDLFKYVLDNLDRLSGKESVAKDV